MPLKLRCDNITQLRVDAIVNAANSSLLRGGGVDGCIHRAAGPQLLAACRTLGGCNTGSAKITEGYRLPCRYVIHAVGPRYQGGCCGERDLLSSCYRTALRLATEHHCKTVAFPLISAGIYGYPKEEALRVAVETITQYLDNTSLDMTVFLVLYDKEACQLGARLFPQLWAPDGAQEANRHDGSGIQ